MPEGSSEAVAGSEVVPGYRRDLHPLPSRKIGIVGTCPSRMLAPFGDPSWEFWTLGPGGKDANRWERLLEIHGAGTWPVGAKTLFDQLGRLLGGDSRAWPEGVREPYEALVSAFNTRKAEPASLAGLEGFDGYLDDLRKIEPPKIVYTERPLLGCKANVVYPRDAMFEKYGRMWFSSSIAYAAALALEDNVTDLGFWGIDLESGEEYRVQYMGAKYFIHLARLAGVNIYMPTGCGLLRDPNPYPDSWETHLAQICDFKLRVLGALKEQAGREYDVTAANLNGREGQLAFLREDLKDALPDAEARAVEIEKSAEALKAHLHQKALAVQAMQGEINAFDFIRKLFVIHGDPV